MEQAVTVWEGRIYLAAGFTSTDYFTNTRYHDVWTTANGSTWLPVTTAQSAGAPARSC